MLPTEPHASETVTVPDSLGTETQTSRFVSAVEADFEKRLADAAETVSRLCVTEDVKIIRLCGPTCSGKTTAAAKLTEVLTDSGLSVYPISIDDFFFGREILIQRATEKGEEPDFETVQAIDLPLLEKSLYELTRTGVTRLPVFDFSVSRRSGYRGLKLQNGTHPVLLLEGIQALYPEVVEITETMHAVSVYISVLRSLRVGKTVFSPEQIRLMRRLVRDASLRDSTAECTLGVWKSVRANEQTNILPYLDSCRIRIDSVMPYEVHILAPLVRNLLNEVSPQSEAYTTALEMLDSLKGIAGIQSSLLPAHSIYREFIPD